MGDIIAEILQKARALNGTSPNAAFGFQQPHNPGSINDLLQRIGQRAGLPGRTTLIDPRLIDPNNSPVASEGSMSRGDINLDTGVEDPSRAISLWKELVKRQLRHPITGEPYK